RRWTVICSKRRAKVTPETLNQSAKKLKSSDKRINKQFFDPSRSMLPAGMARSILFVIKSNHTVLW
ncbi:hypothetical protein J4P41_13390, partial [Gluconobacter sp. NFX36]|uniref:hypothetical protein n=1 Tax=Gluconobacter sp. NFX36 TaxID=2819535 RepID=UPI003CE990DF